LSTVVLCYCTCIRLSVYKWLVQVQPWLLSKMQKIQQYYFVSVNTTVLCYRYTVVLCYCSIVVLCYWSFVVLCYCTSVRLSNMQKIQQYYFVCNYTIYFQTIQFFLLALHHSLCYCDTFVLCYCDTFVLCYWSTVVLC
jgi:hypothetical protein